MQEIKSVDHLKEICAGQGHEFFILLDGGIRSSKLISYDRQAGCFMVDNYVDGTCQTLTARQLYAQSNIGKAMQRGRFFRAS
jgi:hypothetical protein